MRKRITPATILFLLLACLSWAKEIFDWLGRVDFFITHRQDPGWLGDAVRFFMSPPAILYSPPRWLIFSVLLIGLVALYFYDRHLRQGMVAISPAPVPERLEEIEKHKQISRWLGHELSEKSSQINSVVLFGSIVHDHYPTSDVDLLIYLRRMSDRRIGPLVRHIKQKVATEFQNTFSHALHVTFFCEHEGTAMEQFLEKAGKHEAIKIEDEPPTSPSL